MSIGMPGSDSMSVYLCNAKSYLENAMNTIGKIEQVFSESDKFFLSEQCSSVNNELNTSNTLLSEVVCEFSNTKEIIEATDDYNAAQYESAAESSGVDAGTAVKGSVVGVAGAMAGHSAARTTINAFITKGYRGAASQLHGFAFEVMYADKLNYSLQHKLFTKAVVDGSNTPGRDVVLTSFGKAYKQFELKAYKNSSQLKHVLKKNSSQYANSTVVTTKEMAKSAGVKSSGISRAKVMKTTDAAVNSSKAALAVKSIGKSALGGGVAGAVIEGGISAVSGFSQWKSGEITSKEYLSSIGKSVAKGAFTGAVAGAASTAVLMGVAAAGITLSGGGALLVGAAAGAVAATVAEKAIGAAGNALKGLAGLFK